MVIIFSARFQCGIVGVLVCLQYWTTVAQEQSSDVPSSATIPEVPELNPSPHSPSPSSPPSPSPSSPPLSSSTQNPTRQQQPQPQQTACHDVAPSEVSLEACALSGPVVRAILAFLRNNFRNVTCGDSGSVRKAADDLYCSIRALHKQCDVTIRPQTTDYSLPDNPHWEPLRREIFDAINILCLANSSMDQSCLQDHLDNIEQSVQTDVQSYLDMKGGLQSFRDIEPCRYQSMVTLCTLETLEPACGAHTAHPIVAILGHYLAPPDCRGEEHVSKGNCLSNAPLWFISVLMGLVYLNLES